MIAWSVLTTVPPIGTRTSPIAATTATATAATATAAAAAAAAAVAGMGIDNFSHSVVRV